MERDTRIVQLIGDGIQELWEIDRRLSDEQIEGEYKEWIAQDEIGFFDEWIDELGLEFYINRLFVEEIYI